MQQGQHFALAAQDYKGKGKGKGGKGKGKGCHICGERGHWGSECPAGIWHGRQDDPADAADARKAEATKEADLQRKFEEPPAYGAALGASSHLLLTRASAAPQKFGWFTS